MKIVAFCLIIIMFICVIGGCIQENSTDNKYKELYGISNGNMINGGYLLDKTIDNCAFVCFLSMSKTYLAKMDFNKETQGLYSLADHYAKYLNYYDDSIFYLNQDDSFIYRIDLNGENRQILHKGKCKSMFIYNNNIYFTESINSELTLCSMSLDGKQNHEICKVGSASFNIYNNAIYYWVNHSIHAIEISTEDDKILINSASEKFQVYEGTIYVLNDNNQLLRYSGYEKCEVILNATGGNFNIYEGYIYFVMPDKEFNKLDPTLYDKIKSDVLCQHGTVFRTDINGKCLTYGSADDTSVKSQIVINDNNLIAVDSDTANLNLIELSAFSAHEELP